MHRRLVLAILLLAFPVLASAQERTTPELEIEQPPPTAVLRAHEPIDSRVLERIRLPRTADDPASTIVVDPGVIVGEESSLRRETRPLDRQRTVDAAMIDLGAVHDRLGPVAEIQVLRGGRTATAPAGDAGTIRLNRGDILAVRTEPAAQPRIEIDDVTTTRSSTVLYTLDASGRTRELGLIHRSAGLHWRSERGRFAGELLLGIVDLENPRRSGPLDGATVTVQLLAPPGTLDRVDLALSRIGHPFERVAVESELAQDPFSIDFVSQLDPDLPRAELRVHLPRLMLSAPDAIEGLGVGEAVVTVSGASAGLPPGETITLDLNNGWLAERAVIVDASGTASTRVRSAWLGEGTLRIVAPPAYQSAPQVIRYTWPMGFIAATLFGGILGALVLVYMLKRRDPASRQSYVTDWFVGVIIGVAATTMAYAGMTLPEWIPVPPVLAGEVAPFALAFICAAAGTRVVHSIVGTVGSPAKG